MRRLLILALAAGSLHAATIRGLVLENSSGRPLARARVSLAPVAGSNGAGRSARADLSGVFEFTSLPAGVYLVSAARTGFLPAEYGQKNFRSAGQPIVLEQSATAAIEIRLKRFAAIAGTVFDENDVGIPDIDVVAYRDKRPPQLAGRATTDDRGMYRITGLEPGRYLVRSAAKQFEDGGYIPTFSKQTASAEEAQSVEAALDELTDNADVRAMAGSLVKLSGTVVVYPKQPVTVTLASELGRETFMTSSEFHFGPLVPGRYELYAEASDAMMGGYLPLQLESDRSDIRLALSSIQAPQISIRGDGGKPVANAKVQLMARRVDLAGAGPSRTMPNWLGPGRWELMMAPQLNYYVSGFTFNGATWGEPGYRTDLWNRMVVEGGSAQIMVTLASNPGSMEGAVTADQAAAVGAMVFAEPWDPEQRKRLGDPRATRTDVHGHYKFQGLAPGSYRVLATFEYQMPEESEMDRAETRVVKAEAGTKLTQDLDLFVLP